MDLRQRNLAELTIAEELTEKISEKINNGMTLLGTLVGGVNDWTQVYYFYNSDKKAVLDSKDENGELSYDVDCLILVKEQFNIRTKNCGILVPNIKKYSLFEGTLNNYDATTGYPEGLLRNDSVAQVKELYFSDDKIYLSVEELLEFANHIAKTKKLSSSNDEIYLSI